MIRLSKSSITKIEQNAVSRVLKKEYLGMGNEVLIFEKKLSNYFSRNVLCTNSGTSALQLALYGIGITSGDEVLVPSLTFVSSFQAISALGAKPISCDIDISTLTIDLEDIKKKINKKTKAIMIVHYAGGYGRIDDLYKFAKINNLRIIEDAAHAFGSKYKNKLIGSFGDISCFSFDGIKNITCGEGGCVVTKDKNVLDKIASARILGIKNESLYRYKNKRQWKFDVKYQGWRYHMSNIMAAIGIAQLSRFSSLSKKRKLLAKYYDAKLVNNQNIIFLKKDYNQIVPHIYPIRIKNLKNRKSLQIFLLKQGIETGWHYQPNHLLSFYKKKKITLKNTDLVSKELLTLPLHYDLEFKDIDYIISLLNKNLNKFTT
jgi:dTDP-4-amino-4,6-dideoxygalactose transaminase